MTAARNPPSFVSLFALVQTIRDRARRPRLAGVTAEELRGSEIILGFKLPEQLRKWFLLCDGGFLSPPHNLVGLLGNNEVLSVVSMLRDGWPKDKLPVATDGSGSYYCLLTKYRDRRLMPVASVSDLDEEGIEFVVASSLESFLPMFIHSVIKKDSQWPNKTMKWYLERDPDLQRIDDLPLPWTPQERGE